MSTTVIKPEGNRIDLDIIFEGDIVDHTMKNVLEGTPEGGANATFNRDNFSRIKLATQPRMYRDTLLHDFYSFGGWDAGNYHRKDHGGPLVEGPHAYVFELGVMITAHRQPAEVAYLFDADTKIHLRGVWYSVSFPVGRRGKYPTLVALSEEEGNALDLLEIEELGKFVEELKTARGL